MQGSDHAALLLRKAAQDEFVVEKLVPDPAAPAEAIGFDTGAVARLAPSRV
jgi:hypothetical protein